MAITAAQLITEVSAKGVEETKAKLLAMGQTTDDVGRKLAIGLGIGAAVGGAALLALGVKATSMAGDFQAGKTSLVTGAGELQKNIQMVGDGMLKMAVDTGTSTASLTAAMFLVESASFHGAAGLRILQIAAEGAKVGNANLAQTTDILTTTLHDYHLATSQAVPVMNSLIVTVMHGKMVMDDLNQSLTKVLPVSSALQVHMSDVEGALATMAAAGDKGALAGTHLMMMLKVLAQPASAATKEMSAMGISSVTLAQELRTSLPGALEMIQNAVSQHFVPGTVEYNRAIATILGGSKSGIAGLEIMGQSFKDLVANTAAAAGALHNGSKDVQGWVLVQEDFNFKMDKAKEVLETLGIRIGTLLLPVVSKLLDAIIPVVSAFADWATSGHAVSDMAAFLNQHIQVLAPILAGVGAMLLAVIVPAFISLAAAAWTAAAGVIAATWPILAIGAAVAGLVAIFMHFYQTNAPFKTFIDNLVTGFRELWSLIQTNFIPTMQRLGAFFQSTILPALQQVGAFLVGTFKPAWEQLVATWNGQLLPALKMLWGLFQQIWPVLKVVGEVIIGVVIIAFALVVVAIVLVVKWLALLIQGWSWLIAATGAAFSAIGTTITNFKNFVGNIFNAIGTFIHDKILWIYNHNIYVKTFVDLIINFFHNLQVVVGAVFATIASLIGQKLSQAQSFAGNFRDALGSIFSQVSSAIHQKITDAWNWLVSFASGWPASAFQWGASLIQGFINGIGSMVGGVISAAQNVAQTVAHFLGFHASEFGVPPEGPGHEADKWMPAFMKGLVGGIRAGTPEFHTALSLLMAPVGNTLSAPVLAPAYTAPMMAGGSGSSGQQQVNVNVYLNGRALTSELMPHIVSQIRSAVGSIAT